jgi:hypothetical protein
MLNRRAVKKNFTDFATHLLWHEDKHVAMAGREGATEPQVVGSPF